MAENLLEVRRVGPGSSAKSFGGFALYEHDDLSPPCARYSYRAAPAAIGRLRGKRFDSGVRGRSRPRHVWGDVGLRTEVSSLKDDRMLAIVAPCARWRGTT